MAAPFAANWHPAHSHSRRRVGLLAIIAAVGWAQQATAHVTISPRSVPAIGRTAFTASVPNERPASTVRLAIQLPDAFTDVRIAPKTGWQTNLRVTSGRTTLTWSSGRIRPGSRDGFRFAATLAATSRRPIPIPTVQTYAGGEVVRWIGPAGSERPAATVTVTPPLAPASPSVPADATTSTTETTAATSTSPTTGTGTTNDDDGRSPAGLIAGIAAVIVGGALLLRGRRRGPRSRP